MVKNSLEQLEETIKLVRTTFLVPSKDLKCVSRTVEYSFCTVVSIAFTDVSCCNMNLKTMGKWPGKLAKASL